eukprot:TRINITY_DN17094_c0_g1_i1.p1 TRINITY_DN17094_c0_g1~~TRINITY_DN17094_c0_g1_i1.p1  ORF type:complete len:345 (-),score=57.05 TRINITY_DN17094_c0_g1_i1:26-1060(-)
MLQLLKNGVKGTILKNSKLNFQKAQVFYGLFRSYSSETSDNSQIQKPADEVPSTASTTVEATDQTNASTQSAPETIETSSETLSQSQSTPTPAPTATSVPSSTSTPSPTPSPEAATTISSATPTNNLKKEDHKTAQTKAQTTEGQATQARVFKRNDWKQQKRHAQEKDPVIQGFKKKGKGSQSNYKDLQAFRLEQVAPHALRGDLIELLSAFGVDVPVDNFYPEYIFPQFQLRRWWVLVNKEQAKVLINLGENLHFRLSERRIRVFKEDKLTFEERVFNTLGLTASNGRYVLVHDLPLGAHEEDVLKIFYDINVVQNGVQLITSFQNTIQTKRTHHSALVTATL